jgi:hypothetical protein
MMIKAVVLSLGLCLVSQLVHAGERATGENATIKAASVTGWNRYLGEPRYRWDFLAPPLDIAGANTVAEYNPGGSEPLPLSPSSPPDTVLATLADPFLEIVFPPFKVDVTDPDAINVPLREVATMVRGDLTSRGSLPFITEAPVTAQSQAAPGQPNPITLGDWLKGSGRMRIHCRNDGTAKLEVRVRDLIPHRAYTVWAMWHLADGRIFPQPFGGAPNAYITDEDGDAEFERSLNFCPLVAARDGIDGNRLLSVITHLHSDHILYGAVPTPSGAGLPPGTVGHMQLEWNFPGSGTPLLD